ncbi:inhibitory synaptic factor 1 isoform X1 [Danio rerio]|uniref:Inhibitory synaptic factor 1 n=2 Tax=Danio rerio TaxID=7955 RepID=INSY1_DANRE|nr:inhibitory synaptic factor 1 [Danio rerio]XP_005173740.1 UPF0583 protein C15orf59 homolog isoform X1 [Danio rerio]XP_005173741.1 UPF0583 protein C15orf59 homolog isoform X1 [Danio rerio]Q1L899.1 RecName: Full=Inhibitory synaptic factor 1; Short=InSyn1 [Danio rerio]AAI27580.1 Si:dkey-105e17.1 [Danio rerio]AAI55799.1 Si:dkey-105e17.1 [Danio rerio]|eukprot:NP_001073418.1 inhibitory synaptic factor 1 [Danio rerio]
MSQSRAPAREPSETPSQREQIRSHMKMVIQQLEGILKELKDVAHELREVVGQIDKLTSDLELDLDADDWTVATASSTSSSERGLCEAFRLDFLGQDSLSDSWDFCSFLESSSRRSARDDTKPPPTTASVYSQMNGGLPVPNGPLIITPDSSSEEASSSTHSQSQKTSRTAGTRERVRFSDKILYHALCCDDDEDEDEDEDGRDEEEDKLDTDSERSPLAGSPVPPLPELYNCREPPAGGSHTIPRKDALNPGCRKKLLRNSSTQTVSDKSTQTLLPYVPAKHRNKDL